MIKESKSVRISQKVYLKLKFHVLKKEKSMREFLDNAILEQIRIDELRKSRKQ